MDKIQKFLTKFYRGVGTSRGKRLAGYAERGEWARLQAESISSVTCYQNSYAYFRDALVVDVARKLLLPGDADRRRAAAVSTFWASEAQCAQTNVRLDRFLRLQGPFEPSDERVIHFISGWRKILKKRLGTAPKGYELTPRFSGGSTLSDAGKLITIPDKMSSTPTVYASSFDVAYDACKSTPFERMWEVACANRFFTVPKDSSKDRGCCVEASINVALQLDVGRILKRRYHEAYGVDLRHAQSLHRRLARDASAGLRDLITVDLSNASDTISRKLIELVLPSDWFALLNSLRAARTTIDKQVVYLEKFSSMGNGFTFELETWLFRSLLEALGASEAYVYGDDIITTSSLQRDLMGALAFFGFTPNKKKTFCEGPFRESCGGDFFDGKPVRAHFLKEIPDEPQKWLSLANGLRRVDPDLHLLSAAWWFCVDQLPSDWRNFGPSDLGDGLLHVPDAMHHARMRDLSPKSLKRLGVGSTPVLCFRAKVPVSRRYSLGEYWKPEVAMKAGALGVPSDVTTRGDVIGYKTAYLPAWGVNDPQAGFERFA